MPRELLLCVGGPLHGEHHEDYGTELCVPRMSAVGEYLPSSGDAYRMVTYRPRGWGQTRIYAHESLSDMDAAQAAQRMKR